MHTTLRILACLTALLAAILAPVRAADEDDNPEARAEWMKGYEKFEAAQQAEARRNYEEAHRQYGEALAVYEQVKARWPKWNPFILDYRIKFCNDKLRTLAGRIRVDQEKLSATEVTQLNVVTQQKLEVAEGRIVELESQATRLGQALEKARSEAARGTESTQLAEKLAWENRELQQRVKSLEAKQAELGAQLKELEEERGVLQAYRELQQQLEAVRQKRDEIELASRELAGKLEQLVDENKRLSLERAQAELQAKQQASATGAVERNLANAQRQLLAMREQLDERDRTLRERDQAAVEQAKIIADLKDGLEAVRQKTSETERLKALYAETEKQHAQVREELQAAREKGRQSEAQVERAKKDLDTLQVANTALRQEVERLTAMHLAVGELQRERDEARRQLAASEEQVRKSDERTASQIELNRAMRADLQRLTRQLEERDKTATMTGEALQTRARELTVQVGQLEADLNQARRERDQQDKLLAAANQAREKLGQQVTDLQRELAEQTAAEAAKATAREKELTTQVATRDRELADLRAQLAAAAKVEAVDGDAALRQELAERLRQVEAMTRQAAASTEQVAALEAQVAALQAAAKAVPAGSGPVTALEQARQQIATLHQQQAASAKQYQALTAQVTAQQTELAKLRETATQLVATQAELAKLREAATRLAAVEAEAAKLREVANGHQEVTAEVARLREAAAGREEAVAELGRVRQQMADAQAVGKDLQGQLEQLQRLAAAQKALIEQKEQRLGKVEAELTGLRTEFETLKQQAESDKQMLTRQLARALDQYNEQKESAAGAVAARQQAETELAALRAGREVAAAEAISEADREVHKLLSQALEAEKNGSSEAAIWFYQQVLAKDPNHLRALTRLGNLAADAGEYAAAESYLMRAFYQNPDSQDVLVPLGYILVRAEKGDLAVAMLSRAVAIYPEDAALHRHLGVACRALGWVDAAEVQLKRAYALDKTDPDTAFNLAILYSTLDQPDMAAARQWYDLAKQLGAELDPGLERVFSKKQE